jgi:hypothetical protein
MTIRFKQRFSARVLTSVLIFVGSLARISIAFAQTANSAVTLPSLGQVNTPDPYHELETKYLFGFTEGADTRAEGEKSIEFETTTASGLRGGTYAALEQEVEFESVPTQNFGYELSAHALGFSVNDIPGMPDAHGVNFSGLSAEFPTWSSVAVQAHRWGSRSSPSRNGHVLTTGGNRSPTSI